MWILEYMQMRLLLLMSMSMSIESNEHFLITLKTDMKVEN
jgi:hypothetical protein